MESSDVAITEYNQLRASVGMAPASDDDCCEAVAWVVVFNLLAPEVADECKRLLVEERALFMMAYASYVTWLAMGWLHIELFNESGVHCVCAIMTGKILETIGNLAPQVS